MRSSSWLRQYILFVGLFGPLGCGGGEADECPQDGLEGCPCANGLCFNGLQCLSNYCVGSGASGAADPSNAAQATAEPTDGGPADTGDDTGGGPECAAGLKRCAGDCVDVQEHPEHCGECDKVCAGGGVCIAGECAAAVDCSKDPCPGFTYCDPATKKCLPGCDFNPQCGTGAKCDTTTHDCVCNPGFHECGGVCVLDSDPTACGAGCEVCPVVAHGEPACIDGACGATCSLGYHECGGNCYSDQEEVICESNRPTCTVCPNAMGEPYPACDQNDKCTYRCQATGHIPCGDLECKIEEGYFCDVDEDCCQLYGPLTCQYTGNDYWQCLKP
ncbi:hypothetical protein [Nannocystis pusilla]|uniref:EGF-like domain-containing protein n=1 Tax=Nannocystis pusilla TaxID=889268 RepID=A0ABS7TUK9_9BACT|nr:hypothetical protein [Nannocystis pusilla]MBZ5711930.1 hypothetical protein [Nannocystis pusilla]